MSTPSSIGFASGGGPLIDEPGVVVCDQVALTYGRGRASVVAVHSLTCRIDQWTRAAIIGRSGSGKSTVLHLLAGLAAPTTGHISWPALGGPQPGRPGRIGVIFQGPSLLPALTVRENVTFPLQLAGVDPADAANRVDQILDRLHLSDLAPALPQELSGGQAQRVAAARVLAGRPALILADEPTAHLDRDTGAELMNALVDAADALPAALVVATHDPAVAGRLADRWVMSDGRLHTEPGDGGLIG